MRALLVVSRCSCHAEVGRWYLCKSTVVFKCL